MTFTEIINSIKYRLDILYEPITAIVQIVLILVFAIFARKIGFYITDKFFEKQKKFKYSFDEKRTATIKSLTKSILRYGIYFMAGVAILAKLTAAFKLGSVMTAAGIGGLAIGFGAQSLIKDVISGFFIILENQFIVGDNVTIDGMTGTVEGMELRVTRIRNFNGDLYIIPNGEIKKMTNHVRGDKAVIVDIPVAYTANINNVLEIASQICEKVGEEFETIVEKPTVLGITELGKENLNVRIMAKTIANEQWAVERRIRKLIKEAFENENIDFRQNTIIYDKLDK